MMLSLKPPMTYPSGAALATRSAPINPAAPGWFSITIACPMFSDIRCARIRAALSTALAAAKGTIIWIGRFGYAGCAIATEHAPARKETIAPKATRHLNDIGPPCHELL